MTLDLTIDGEPFHAQVEVRYLPAPERWYVSIWDHSSSELLVNMIPLICSYGKVNDLLLPFRRLREGRGLGFLICLRATDDPSTPDPIGKNLNERLLSEASVIREGHYLLLRYSIIHMELSASHDRHIE